MYSNFITRGFGGFFIFFLGYGGFLGVKKPHARAKSLAVAARSVGSGGTSNSDVGELYL